MTKCDCEKGYACSFCMPHEIFVTGAMPANMPDANGDIITEEAARKAGMTVKDGIITLSGVVTKSHFDENGIRVIDQIKLEHANINPPNKDESPDK